MSLWFTSGGVLSTTWKPFAFVLVIALLVGWMAGVCCPAAITIVEVFKLCP